MTRIFIIRPATAADYQALYGPRLPTSMRALTAELNGEPVGIAGFYYIDGQVNAFSRAKLDDGGKPLLTKTEIARGTLHVLKMFRRLGIPVTALADREIEGAADFLARCGFVQVAETSQGQVFRFGAPQRLERAA